MAQRNKPDFERLLDAVEGRISAEEARVVFEQVAQADQATQAELGWLRRFVELSQTTVLQAPPAQVRAMLARRFGAFARQRPLGGLRRLLATPMFDSASAPLTAGTRGVGAAHDRRQLIFNTDVADIAIDIRPHPHAAALDVHGQIFPTEDISLDYMVVQLVRSDAEAGITTGDELGEWTIERVPAGTYDLIVSTAAIEVVIREVVLDL